MHKIRILAVCILFKALAVFLTGCSSGKVPGEDDSDDGGSGASACVAVGDLTVTEVNGQCIIGGTLTVSASIPANTEWRINGSVQVTGGVLTIQAGVKMRAATDEFIYVGPDAAIAAMGTAVAPIIFSSLDSEVFNDITRVDNYDRDTDAVVGEWVGIVIEDNLASESKNELNYVIVAEAGRPVTIGGEIANAGITLIGDHENTILRFVQVHDPAGDGIALRSTVGSNVARMEAILVTGAGRDGISYSNFSGLIKDLLVIHRSGIYPDNGGEIRNGRAGIRAESGDANPTLYPLIVNATLVGNDASSTAADEIDDEVGIVFENMLPGIRLANVVFANFRNGCYQIGSDVDLSGVLVANIPTGSSIDGVHCANEIGNAVGDVISGGVDLTEVGAGNGQGFRLYGAANSIVFRGEINSGVGFSERWFVESVDGETNAFGGLMLYNNGDTNNDSVTDGADVGFAPFFNLGGSDDNFLGVVTPDRLLLFCGDPVVLGPGDNFVNPTNNSVIVPQPPDGSFVCGFVLRPGSASGFNLTQVGGVNGASLALFDSWTLQDGAVSPAVTGFDP